jgi:hypothetical protein
MSNIPCGRLSGVSLAYVWFDRHAPMKGDVPPAVHARANLSARALHSTLSCEVNVTVFTFREVHRLLSSLDHGLAQLFTKINPAYGALLADIARCAIVYRFGGIYLDGKYSLTRAEVVHLVADLQVMDGTFWRWPNKNVSDCPPWCVGNAGIAAAHAGSPVLRTCLSLQSRWLHQTFRAWRAAATGNASTQEEFGLARNCCPHAKSTCRLGTPAGCVGWIGSGALLGTLDSELQMNDTFARPSNWAPSGLRKLRGALLDRWAAAPLHGTYHGEQLLARVWDVDMDSKFYESYHHDEHGRDISWRNAGEPIFME